MNEATLRAHVTLTPAASADVPRLWTRVLESLEPPEAHFGPECRESRPRARDTYFALRLDEATTPAPERRHEDAIIGLAYTQRPAPTTTIYAAGLFVEWRGMGLSRAVWNAIAAHCFADPRVMKIEAEIYSSNTRWLARRRRSSPMREEGIQRATIRVNDQCYDRVLFGLLRSEWEQR